MVNFTLDAMVSSMPVIRPLWMLDPNDHANLVIDDEFLIGNKVILIHFLYCRQLGNEIVTKQKEVQGCGKEHHLKR